MDMDMAKLSMCMRMRSVSISDAFVDIAIMDTFVV